MRVKKPYSYYKKIVDELKIRKVVKSTFPRFNAKRFLTYELPYRLKTIGKKQPLLFRKLYMYTPLNKPSLLVKKVIESEYQKRSFFNELAEKSGSEKFYEPKTEFKFLLQNARFKYFTHSLHSFLTQNSKFSAFFRGLPPNWISHLSLEKQNEIILKFFKRLSEKKEDEKRINNLMRDSHELFVEVSNEFNWEEYYIKDSVSDDDYLFEDDIT